MILLETLSILLVWLLVCMVYDLRYREVPMWLTLIAMIAAGVFSLAQGHWVPPLLTASLIHISDFEPRAKRYAFASVVSAFAAIFDPATAVTVFILAAIWLLWEVGAMGGADAKLLMVIALVVSQPVVFLFIALAGGLQGALALTLRKKEVPYIVAIFAGASLFTVNSFMVQIF